MDLPMNWAAGDKRFPTRDEALDYLRSRTAFLQKLNLIDFLKSCPSFRGDAEAVADELLDHYVMEHRP
ncbi:MAG: hypothetical protein KGL39_05165 [Patescibacteria group bacterium]|nr:hypothetical protein [Patescibacteria group bacterium]